MQHSRNLGACETPLISQTHLALDRHDGYVDLSGRISGTLKVVPIRMTPVGPPNWLLPSLENVIGTSVHSLQEKVNRIKKDF